MKLRVSLTAILLAAFGAAYGAQQQPPESDRYRPTSSIKDIMVSMIDPSADYLWDAVASTISPNGVISTKTPRTVEDWQNARQRAITLVEAANLIMMPGRRVAMPGTKSENPGIELEPAEIEKLIAEKPSAWIDFSHGMQDAATQILAAIDAKNAKKLLDMGDLLDQTCENCHLKYWYPNESPGAPTGPRR